jgi:pilus assembly protein TadC
MGFENLFQGMIGTKKYNLFLLYLEKENKQFENYLQKSYLSYFIFIIFFFVLFLLNYMAWFFLIFFIFIFFPISFIVNYFLILYKEDLKQKEIDNSLPDVMLQASLFPKGTDITQILGYIARQDYGYISREFNIALDQIDKGFSVEVALKGILNRNKSRLLQRVINLLIIGYLSGKDMAFVFNRVSQDILKTQGIERDRYSGLAIQKYTLLASSAILVPIVLSWVMGTVQDFNIGNSSMFGLSEADPKMFSYSMLATLIYLGEFSIISSVFISIIDGNWRKFILYALFITPIAYLIFLL